MRIVVPLLLLLGIPAGAAAQGDPGDAAPASGGPRLLPIPILFYTPETHLGFGASAIYFPSGMGDGVAGRPTNLSGVLLFTTRSQFLAAFGLEAFPGAGRYELRSGASFRKFPTEYYGIGNDTRDTAEETYTPRQFDLEAVLLRRLGDTVWIGGGIEAGWFELLESEADGLIDAGEAPGADGGWTNGVEVQAALDTRSRRFSPERGVWFQTAVARYDEALGSDFSFTRTRVDLRAYRSVGDRFVVAARAVTAFTDGGAPFYALPGLGGSELLRGHFEGRFRDRHLGAVQAELRADLFWILGGALFLEAGQVATDLDGFSWRKAHVSGGFGLRFLLNRERGVKIRTDWGTSEGSSGFYVALDEAF